MHERIRLIKRRVQANWQSARQPCLVWQYQFLAQSCLEIQWKQIILWFTSNICCLERIFRNKRPMRESTGIAGNTGCTECKGQTQWRYATAVGFPAGTPPASPPLSFECVAMHTINTRRIVLDKRVAPWLLTCLTKIRDCYSENVTAFYAQVPSWQCQ